MCKQYLTWGLEYINITYFGLFGYPGFIGNSAGLCTSEVLSVSESQPEAPRLGLVALK